MKSASFVAALQAAHDAAAGQHYPQGALYVVATPIGNLADVTLRALHLLSIADTLACEDTRHSQQLLRAWGIDQPATRWLAVHQHNEAQAAQGVLARLGAGQRVAYLSDAGTPAVSDPGARLVAAARAASFPVVPLPGASSVTTAVSAAGLESDGSFVFVGFPATRATERDALLQRLAAEPRAVVLLEAPHRIQALAQALARLGSRLLTVGRELTKQFEQIETLAANDFSVWLSAAPERLRGEFVLVLHPDAAAGETSDGTRVLEILLAELPLSSAVRLAVEITGEKRNSLYQKALLSSSKIIIGP